MDNQHKAIRGYRDLTAEEIELMNAIKLKGEELGELLAKVEKHIDQQVNSATRNGQSAEYARLCKAEPTKWLSAGQMQIQQGLMAVTRSVAQPSFF